MFNKTAVIAWLIFFNVCSSAEVSSGQEMRSGSYAGAAGSREALSFATEVNGEWGRNPFLSPEEIFSLERSGEKERVETTAIEEVQETREPPAEPKPLPVVVKSIIVSGSKRVATINGKIVSVGDRIGDERIAAINDDSILLRKGKEWRRISIEQPSTPPIRVKEPK